MSQEEPLLLSKSAFAARCNVATSAVSNWIARGKLSGAALTADGKIAVQEAERQLRMTVDPGRGATRASQAMPWANDTAAADEPTDSPMGSLVDLRRRSEELKIRRQERLDEEEIQQAKLRRGELIRTDEAARAWAAEHAAMIAAMDVFVNELPIKLGLGREAVDIARREWREFRRRQADQAGARAV